MKPKWEDAPDWAKFLAMDEDGFWEWYEERPVIGTRYSTCWVSGANSVKAGDGGFPWMESLEPRP